ncbi:NAD(P)-dependent oxidoreductase [Streptomyces griseoluteus]|uniref:NAD(P)-dependent oxidoreductase n=1 Tax=Streptomyces griseoluteus TaxID=29306 RepID=UPI00365B97D4
MPRLVTSVGGGRMTLRRVPALSREGKSVTIVSPSPNGVVSRLADEAENRQVDGAVVFLGVTAPMIEAGKLTPEQTTYLFREARIHLRDIIAIAESRGERLGVVPDPVDEDGDEEDE